jgi:hypothetical protein
VEERAVTQQLKVSLAQFTFDDPTAERPFTVRLAEENGWTPEFTLRAIEEYRRFLYLAVTCDHSVVPSQIVDKVWHLHLIYTRSYWNDLCRGVLGRPLHHHPSPGGAEAEEASQHAISRMFASYRAAFGEPPYDIWPQASYWYPNCAGPNRCCSGYGNCCCP